MFKLALILALVTLAAGVALETSERNYAHAPKCYITYKKCCSYKKPVYGKCYKKVCRKVKECKYAHHAADLDAAAAAPVLDASVKKYYGGHTPHKQQQCYYVNQCKKQAYDCIKKYDEDFHCEHEKKKHGSFHDW